MVLTESHKRDCDERALEYNSTNVLHAAIRSTLVSQQKKRKMSHSRIFGTMKRRQVFYPTLFKDIVVPPTTRSKVGTLTAFYSHGVGGFDLRPFVLEILEK